MSNSLDKSVDFLWHSFLEGNDKSFAIIYQRHIEQLISYGYKLSYDRELVHDCIQEVFMDLFLKRKKLSVNIENLKAYLFVAFRNGLIKEISKSRKFETLDTDKCKEYLIFNVEYSFQYKLIKLEISNERRNCLKDVINSLPSRQKEIIYLKFEEELGYSEISEIMKLSVESARKLLYRALLSLRKIIEPKTFQILFHIFFKKS